MAAELRVVHSAPLADDVKLERFCVLCQHVPEATADPSVRQCPECKEGLLATGPAALDVGAAEAVMIVDQRYTVVEASSTIAKVITGQRPPLAGVTIAHLLVAARSTVSDARPVVAALSEASTGQEPVVRISVRQPNEVGVRFQARISPVSPGRFLAIALHR